MTISDLIIHLEEIKNKHGELNIELVVRDEIEEARSCRLRETNWFTRSEKTVLISTYY